MYIKSNSKFYIVIAAIITITFLMQPQTSISAEVSVAPISSFESVLSEQFETNTQWNEEVNQNYINYPMEHKPKNQILASFFKNKSLSISIPLQHKRKSSDMIANNEKRVIKHLNVKNN